MLLKPDVVRGGFVTADRIPTNCLQLGSSDIFDQPRTGRTNACSWPTTVVSSRGMWEAPLDALQGKQTLKWYGTDDERRAIIDAAIHSKADDIAVAPHS